MINDIDVFWRKILTLAGAGALTAASCLLAAHAEPGNIAQVNEGITRAQQQAAEAVADANSLSAAEAEHAVEALEQQLLAENSTGGSASAGGQYESAGSSAPAGKEHKVTAAEASESINRAYARSAAASGAYDERNARQAAARNSAAAAADRKDEDNNSIDTANVSQLLKTGSVKDDDIGAGKELVLERSFSISYVKVPARCEEDTLKSTCTRLVNYYARRFEREMVSNISIDYDESDPFNKDNFKNNLNREKSVQHIQMSVYSHPGDQLLTMFSIFRQRIAGGKEQLLVETINFESKSGRVIRFNELFENPQLASMLCARAIEAEYRKYNSPLLPVVISATELSPSNFIITPRGLRFFFAPGLVKPDSKIADSMLVRLDKLKSARPDSRWWSGKNIPVTEEQKQALANSVLADVIKLDGNDKLEKLNAVEARRQAQMAADRIGADPLDDAVRGNRQSVVQRSDRPAASEEAQTRQR